MLFVILKDMFPEDTQRSSELTHLLQKYGFTKNEMGIAIIDLNESTPRIFGYSMDRFIYPASVYKIFIGAEMLRRIELGDFALDQIIAISSPNDIDKDAKIFPEDTQNVLYVGDMVTIDYLLDLMLTRSDNTASNILIDLVGHESIAEHIIGRYNWHGSEVTRTFLDRTKEDTPYQYSSTTLSCSRHLAEFMYLVETETLISAFVSRKMKEYLLRWNREGRSGLNIFEFKNYYHKGGWLETNVWKHSWLSAIKNIFHKGWAVIRWNNDVGVVTGERSRYVVAVLSVHKSIPPNKYFPMQQLAKLIHEYLESSLA